MPTHRHVCVVEVERVACCAIDERRGHPRRALGASDEACFIRSLGADDFLDENFCQRLARAGERDAEEIEQAVARDLARVGGGLFPSDATNGANQSARRLEFIAHKTALDRNIVESSKPLPAAGFW